ncbi:TrfB-related DNA-binding protein [Xylella fastidiosa]|nr:TrfB-related DNA-binding protein [Xylella fastidiosa]
MRAKRRTTAAEFEAVRPFLKISDDRIKAARAVLVEGQTLQAIGDRFGWSRQAVDQAVRVVWNTLDKYRQSQRAVANTGALCLPNCARI